MSTTRSPAIRVRNAAASPKLFPKRTYYFKLSAFQEKLLDLYEKQPDFILPETRRNEVLAFVKKGLSDLSISRTTIKWGIPVPDEAEARLLCLVRCVDHLYERRREGENLWPADLHLIGKEIVRFHAIYWPAFLMAAGLPLPKRIFAHGWLLFENDKMSKSRGNIVRATPIHKVLGTDALRYFLLREVVFGQDGSFSFDALVGRYNSDLANGLGNLASRTLAMINQYRGGVIPASDGESADRADRARILRSRSNAFDDSNSRRRSKRIWALIGAVDKYIVEQAPWKLAKGGDAEAEALWTKFSTPRRRRCASSRPCWRRCCPSRPRRFGRSSVSPRRSSHMKTADLHWGRLKGGQALGAVSASVPARRRQDRRSRK